MVQRRIVGGVDEELGGARVRLGAARQGERASFVLQAISGFVENGGTEPLHLGLEILGKAAALDHEVPDDAVEDGSVVETLVDIRQEVDDGHDGVASKELRRDGAFTRVDHDLRIRWRRRLLRHRIHREPAPQQDRETTRR